MLETIIGNLDAILFYVFAGLALGSAVMVVAQRNPTYSAFSFIVTLCSLSAIFALLGSPFIAVLQIVVYAGAIMVLFVFVMMLLNVKSEERIPGESRTLKAVALGLGGLLLAQVGSVFLKGPALPLAPGFDASTRAVARILFSAEYVYVFEATSILILAALVGAVALAKRDL
jgi:NADH-quinone oxidoreductase subunit J